MTRSACATSWLHDARYGYGIGLAMRAYGNPHHDAVRRANEFRARIVPVYVYSCSNPEGKDGYLMSNKRAAHSRRRMRLATPNVLGAGLGSQERNPRYEGGRKIQGQKAYLAMLR